MIYGIGTDIVETRRIKEIIDKHDNSFLEKVFTDFEIKEGMEKKKYVTYFAGRWAAKEALAKALGTGIGAECNWLDIEIRNKEGGRPVFLLKGTVRDSMNIKDIGSTHISISHEHEYATAVVVLEKIN
jgi:holo-[acyl-carrier protein] synthase